MTNEDRLRAALEEIAAGQTEEPAHPFAGVVGRAFVARAESAFWNKSAAFAMGADYGQKRGRFDAAEIARRALRGAP